MSISERHYDTKLKREVCPDVHKRYWYGNVPTYYPCGFLSDVKMTCDTLQELLEYKLNDDDEPNDEDYAKKFCWDYQNRKFINPSTELKLNKGE
uniref:Uncharacterized protein n=1 Tax=viral metagenome TaxID=1070528 RepID=A0A6M3LGM5_9ZZZZ